MVTARGKVILFGEHAVVYGHPALAAALALGVSVDVTDAEEDAVRVPDWNLDATAPDHPVLRALARIKQALGVTRAVAVAGTADLPPRAGLGSSAALAVATARALAPGASDEDVERAANEGEAVFHDSPSGVDVALASRGGIGLYRRGAGLEPLPLPPFPLLIGLSAEPRDTAQRVAQVAALRERAPRETDRRLQALGDLALAARDVLTRGWLHGLGAMFDEAQRHLLALGLGSPGIERLVLLAKGAGALGAKLTGAGGGGAVVAMAPDGEERVLRAWREAGFTGLVAEVGGR